LKYIDKNQTIELLNTKIIQRFKYENQSQTIKTKKYQIAIKNLYDWMV